MKTSAKLMEQPQMVLEYVILGAGASDGHEHEPDDRKTMKHTSPQTCAAQLCVVVRNGDDLKHEQH